MAGIGRWIRVGHRPSLKPIWLTGSLAGLGIIGILSTFTAVDPLFAIYNSLRLFVLFIAVIVLIDKPPSPGFVASAAAVMLLIQAAVALPQFFFQRSVGLAWLGERILDLDYPGISRLGVGTRYWMRAYGLSDHPNVLGGMLATGLTLGAGWWLGHRPRSRWNHFWAGLLFVVGVAALFSSYSRSAWLGLMLGLAFLVVSRASIDRLPTLARRVGFMGILALLAALPVYAASADFLRSRVQPLDTNAPNKTESRAINDRVLLMDTAGGFIA